VAFYRKLVTDEVLEPVFEEGAEVHWSEHIPQLIDWEPAPWSADPSIL
jgi:truncated hemoglobin YjbI